MEKKTTEAAIESSPTWETLEAFARTGIQKLLQSILEEEVTELLGREKSARRTMSGNGVYSLLGDAKIYDPPSRRG
jgi:transposase-like protein